MSIKVLYIHPSGVFGGASQSLLILLKNLKDNVYPVVVTPTGKFSEILNREGIEVLDTYGISQFDNTLFGHYRKARWLILIRELFYIPFTLWVILKAKIKYKHFDIIHINEITPIISILICKAVFTAPIIVHVRSVQVGNAASYRSKLIMKIINKNCSKLIAIDETVKKSIPSVPNAVVVHNSYIIDDAECQDGAIHNLASELPSNTLRVGMVSNFLKFKGITEFITAAKVCKDLKINVMFLIIGGEVRSSKKIKTRLFKWLGISNDVKAECLKFRHENKLKDVLYFFNFSDKLNWFYKEIDVICFPSYLNAVGRPVIEAAYYKKPSIVAMQNSEKDTVRPMETGITINKQDVNSLVKAIKYFHDNPNEIQRMGYLAYKLAVENFSPDKNATKIEDIYNNLIN
ncbi:MAG: glycosyltransferase [Gammaproteobacteria bacterium]